MMQAEMYVSILLIKLLQKMTLPLVSFLFSLDHIFIKQFH